MIKTGFQYLLAVFFIFGGVMHFVNPEFYLPMMPPYIPAHEFMVMLSGVTEIVAGIMLAIPKTTKAGAWFIIAHLVIFFSVHIYMIQEAATEFSDVPLAALWIRIPVQFLFIAWAFWFTRDTIAKQENTPDSTSESEVS
jgi:uncharacterized membrane protein